MKSFGINAVQDGQLTNPSIINSRGKYTDSIANVFKLYV